MGALSTSWIASVAQLVEHRFLNREVVGSSPTGGTRGFRSRGGIIKLPTSIRLALVARYCPSRSMGAVPRQLVCSLPLASTGDPLAKLAHLKNTAPSLSFGRFRGPQQLHVGSGAV